MTHTRTTSGASWRWWVALGASTVALVAALAHAGGGATAAGPSSGMVCTSDPDSGPGATRTSAFVLTARAGTITTPDGSALPMWGYSHGADAFQYPSPTLCATEGDTVTIVLRNTLPEDVSIIFPGQTGVQADGVPSSPVMRGTAIASLTRTAGATGGSVTYRFTAAKPGTYLYQSGTDQAKQVEMGLFGALIIRPENAADHAYGPDTAFNPATEYLALMSSVDPEFHGRVSRRQPVDVSSIHPKYWMLNGRSFPDTLAPNFASSLPSQPYGALQHIQPFNAATNPRPSLVRYINATALDHPFHPHGNHGRVVAEDGRELRGPAGQDRSFEKFTVVVGPGQTTDVLAVWEDVDAWDPVTKPIPIPEPVKENLVFKDGASYYSGSPYLGHKDDLPVGVTSFNQCGEYYHVAHSHAVFEATNNGAGMGGMLTLQRVDPPGGCN